MFRAIDLPINPSPMYPTLSMVTPLFVNEFEDYNRPLPASPKYERGSLDDYPELFIRIWGRSPKARSLPLEREAGFS
jgi:hypothetical protein